MTTVWSISPHLTFVEFLPGKEGLVHISKMAWNRVEKVEDVLHEGDKVHVKLIEIDSQGRLNLSIRDCLPKPEGYVEEEPRRREGRPNRRTSAVTMRAATKHPRIRRAEEESSKKLNIKG